MNTLRRCQPLCGTLFEIEISGLNLNDDQLIEDSTKAFQKASSLEKTFSPFDSQSELSQFNQISVNEVFEASPLFYEAMTKTKFLLEETEGLFTPYKEKQKLSFVLLGKNKIKKIESASININGFIKGWIVDSITEFFIDSGCNRVLVNGGGDLRYWFDPQNSAQVDHPAVAIRDPINRAKVTNLILNQPSAVATSGHYAYDFEHPKDHEIHFAEKDMKKAFFFTATAVASECWLADALTKVLVQNHKQAEICARKWQAKLYFKSQEEELCFEPSKI